MWWVWMNMFYADTSCDTLSHIVMCAQGWTCREKSRVRVFCPQVSCLWPAPRAWLAWFSFCRERPWKLHQAPFQAPAQSLRDIARILLEMVGGSTSGGCAPLSPLASGRSSLNIGPPWEVVEGRTDLVALKDYVHRPNSLWTPAVSPAIHTIDHSVLLRLL